MMDYRPVPDLDYTEIRKRAERRLALRLSAILHIISIVVLSPGFYNTGIEYWWFFVFILHLFYWLYSELRERAVRREIEQEERRWMLRQGGDEIAKRKRDDAAVYRLSDDGELVEIDDAVVAKDQQQHGR